jgi:Domain of unknown function (DUF4440)
MDETNGRNVSHADSGHVPDASTFQALMKRWADAVAGRDPALFDALWAADYSYTSPDGIRLTRAEIMDLEMDVPVPGPMHDIRVQEVVDGVVIVRGGHPLKGEFESEHVRSDLAEQVSRGVEIAFTSVWRRQPDGAWKVVSNDAHIVRTG